MRPEQGPEFEEPGSEHEEQEVDEDWLVMKHIDLERLPRLAVSLRLAEAQAGDGSSTAQFGDVCTVELPPTQGLYNIFWVLRFGDGLRWILKVPQTGCRGHFARSWSRGVITEALTMKLLARKTTMPIPKAHDFHGWTDSELRCPYILMDYVDGIGGAECWFDDSIDATILEQRRERMLHDVANAMVQLKTFSFVSGGDLEFDAQGDACGVVPMDRTIFDTRSSPEEKVGRATGVSVGPFTTQLEFMSQLYDFRTPPDDAYEHGIYRLLGRFMEWITADQQPSLFVLGHGHFELSQLIVSSEGALLGLIGWNDASALPLCLGYEAFPHWITRDWNPFADREGDYIADNWMEKLARYRKMYAKFIRAAGLEPSERQWTGRSLLFQSLQLAADDYRYTYEVVVQVFAAVRRVQTERAQAAAQAAADAAVQGPNRGREDADEDKEEEGEKENEESINTDSEYEWDLLEFIPDEIGGEFDPEQLAMLKKGFRALCRWLDRLGVEEGASTG